MNKDLILKRILEAYPEYNFDIAEEEKNGITNYYLLLDGKKFGVSYAKTTRTPFFLNEENLLFDLLSKNINKVLSGKKKEKFEVANSGVDSITIEAAELPVVETKKKRTTKKKKEE